MTSRELVKNTIHFDNPGRIPYMVLIDIPRFEEERDQKELEVIRKLLDEAQYDFLRVVDHPLEKDWSLAKEYKVPDPYGPGRFDDAKGLMEKYKDGYHPGRVSML